MTSIYFLTLRQLSGRWRIAILMVLATMPVLIALLMLQSEHAPAVAQFERSVLSTMLAGSIAPLMVLAIATAAFGNELEDQTLANLTLSPVPRWQIALPKLLAAITVAAPFMTASALLTSYIAFLGDPTAVLAVTVAVLVGVALYASLFVWLGLVTSQAVGLGLLYIVLWEGFFSSFVAGVRLLSIRHYTIALMHGIDPRRFAAGDHLLPAVAVAVCVLIFSGFLFFTVRRLRHMDVP